MTNNVWILHSQPPQSHLFGRLWLVVSIAHFSSKHRVTAFDYYHVCGIVFLPLGVGNVYQNLILLHKFVYCHFLLDYLMPLVQCF